MVRPLALTGAALAALAVLSPATLAEKKPVFGTRTQISDGFVGKIYYLKRGTHRLPDFSKLKAQGTIYTRTLDVSTRSFSSGFPGVSKRIEWFAIVFRTRMHIRTAGRYRFTLRSDDGSKLYVDGKLVVNNDGTHPPRSRSGHIDLQPGTHTVEVQYFQGPRYHVALQLFWTPPGGKREIFGKSGGLRTPGVRPPPKPPAAVWGYLSVSANDVRIAGATQVALIMDSSGSMRAKLEDGTRRIAAAKRVMIRVINQLPPFVRVSLRAYGHRHPSKPKRRSCRDTQLLVPFGKLDRAALKLAVSRLKPRGQTPIGYSLRQLLRDFRGKKGPKLVLLVSDGIETCDPNAGDPNHPVAMIRRLRAAGVNVQVNVVGIDIGKETARTFLKAIAKAGNGRYIDARNQTELERAIREGLSSSFDVIDAGGKVVARGTVGRGRVRLKAGTYTVVIRANPAIRIARVVVTGAKTRALFVERKGDTVSVKREVR